MKIPEPVLEWFSICCLGKLAVERLSIREYFLFPLPVIIAYVLLSLYPNFLWVSQGENTHWFRSVVNCPDLPHSDNFYLRNCFLRHNIVWFVMSTYALYTVLIYKNRFFLLLNDFKDKNVIDDDTYKEVNNSLISKKRFFLFLVLFEILFYIEWHQPYDIAGIFIAVIILPIGAQIFSAFTAGVILPIILSKGTVRVNVFDADKRGGLKPISELLIVLTSIYFFGILFTYILYPPFYNFFGLIFIMFGVFIFFVPQIYTHRSLAEEKTRLLRYIQDKISNWIREAIEIEHDKRQSQDTGFQGRLSSFQNIRSEIDIMGTWPFDINILKFLLSFSIPIIAFVVNLANSTKPLPFDDIINLINQIVVATTNS
ncbi:MAG: hypothetical protein WAL66_15440 [Nitrososphaeraceae archaeon]